MSIDVRLHFLDLRAVRNRVPTDQPRILDKIDNPDIDGNYRVVHLELEEVRLLYDRLSRTDEERRAADLLGHYLAGRSL